MEGLLSYYSRVQRALDEIEVQGPGAAPDIWDRGELDALPIKHYGPMIFSAPVFHPDECDYLVNVSDIYRKQFTPNYEEEVDYRIDELMLETISTDLYDQCSFLAYHRISPLFRLIMGHEPKIASSIQLARYTPKGTAQTGFHTDDESELTCVVSLAPERYAGGGTFFRPYGICGTELYVPPLPKGHGLFFSGRYVHHRGGLVESGEKLVLVYWLMMNRLVKDKP